MVFFLLNPKLFIPKETIIGSDDKLKMADRLDMEANTDVIVQITVQL